MNIEIGEWYINKTWRFLLPCLRGHGNTFVEKFNLVFKLGAAIHDILLDGSDMSEGRNILILCDKEHKREDYDRFLNWVKLQNYYRGNYCPNSEEEYSRKEVIIIQVPTQFYNAYDCFLRGEYSKMYTEDQVEALFTGKDKKEVLEILKKTEEAGNAFVKNIENEFGEEGIKLEEIEGEYEFPLVRKEEIINCCAGDVRVYFNERLDKNWLVEEEVVATDEQIMDALKNNRI